MKRFRNSTLPFLLSALLGITGVATAADYMEMDLEQLMQVKVTGSTLRDESLKTVPAQVTVFTREQLDVLGLDYLHELVRLVAGFQVNRNADNPLNYSFSASGRRLGSRAREIVLVVDGRIYIDPRSSGADSGFSLFPLAQIERVEVIQGPGSALYGSGAYTGVINIISRRHAKALSLSAGSDERRKADLHWSFDSGQWLTSLFAHAYDDAGQTYRLANGQTTNDPRNELGLDLAIQHDETQLQAGYYRLSADNSYVLEKVRDGFNYFQQEFRQLSVEQKFQLTDFWQMRMALGYQDAEQILHGALTQEGGLLARSQPPSADAMLLQTEFFSRATKLGATNDVNVSDRSSMQFGMEWVHVEDIEANAYTNFDLGQLVKRQIPINYYGNFDHATVIEAASSRDSAGAYGQFLHDLSGNTRLTLGLRYDYYEGVGDHLTPRLGLVHQLTGHHSLKFLYGEAFRAPTLAEINLKNNPFLVGNPDLEHELVNTWNLIWVGTWDATTTNLSAFYSDYQNPIISGLKDGARTYINSSDQISQGLSFDIKQQIGTQWLMRASITRLIDLPDPAFAEAEELGALVVNYQQGKWNWNLSASYQGDREYLLTTTQRAPIASVWLANGQVSYQLNQSTRVRLTGKNLLDESNPGIPLGAGIVNGVPNRGRELNAGVDWRW